MMWHLVLLLGIALCVAGDPWMESPQSSLHGGPRTSRFLAFPHYDSYIVRDEHERLAHGRQLKIYLPKNVHRLEFIPAGEYEAHLLWEERVGRGRVTGTGSNRHWYLDKVTFEDEGTYIQKDFWNREGSTVKVAIVARQVFSECIAGESLKVDLEGLRLEDANLDFISEAGNVTLVTDGAAVSQDLADYSDRVRTHWDHIEIRHVNSSDEGRYYLKDRKARLVSATRMDLTDSIGAGGDTNNWTWEMIVTWMKSGLCDIMQSMRAGSK